MRTRAKRLGIAYLFILAASGPFSGATTGQEARKSGPVDPAMALAPIDRSKWKLQTPDASIDAAHRVLGLARSTKRPADAELTALQEDNIPHLSEQVIGRSLWQVTIRNWSMELPSIPPGFKARVKDRYIRTIDVYLDPENGQLVKVKTRWPEGEPLMAPEPTATSATRQLTNAGQEVYHRFPVGDPKLSFLEALDSIQRGGALPPAAKQIVAHYVIRSAWGEYSTPRAVWAITLRGEPPLLSMVTAERYQNRYIIDAQTGEYLCASNIPKPDKPEPGVAEHK